MEVPTRPVPWVTPKQYVHIDKSDDAHFREVRFISVNCFNLFWVIVAAIDDSKMRSTK